MCGHTIILFIEDRDRCDRKGRKWQKKGYSNIRTCDRDEKDDYDHGGEHESDEDTDKEGSRVAIKDMIAAEVGKETMSKSVSELEVDIGRRHLHGK